jgi:hypothetical protein
VSGHGWVKPNPDGSRARCGGPAICPACALEAGQQLATQHRATTEPNDPDVHVDWHMLPAEWEELRAVLTGELDPADSVYIRHLKESGAV